MQFVPLQILPACWSPQFEQRKFTKCYGKFTSIWCQHSRMFLFCKIIAAQMQQMSLFNSLALRQIRNHVIDDNNYIWNLSWVVSNNDRFDHHEWWDCLKLHDQHWAKSIYHKIVKTRARRAACYKIAGAARLDNFLIYYMSLFIVNIDKRWRLKFV